MVELKPGRKFHIYNEYIWMLIVLTLLVCMREDVLSTKTKINRPVDYLRYGYNPANIHLPKNELTSDQRTSYYYNPNCYLRPMYFYKKENLEDSYVCKCHEYHKPEHRIHMYKSIRFDKESLLDNCRNELQRLENERDFATYMYHNEDEVVTGSDFLLLLDIDSGFTSTFKSLATQLRGHLNDDKNRLHFVGIRIAIYTRRYMNDNYEVNKVLDFTDEYDRVSDLLLLMAQSEENNKSLVVNNASNGQEIEHLIQLLSRKVNDGNNKEKSPLSYYKNIIDKYEKRNTDLQEIDWRVNARRLLLMTSPTRKGLVQNYLPKIKNYLNNFSSILSKCIIDKRKYEYGNSCSNLTYKPTVLDAQDKVVSLEEETFLDVKYNLGREYNYASDVSGVIATLGDILIDQKITLINILDVDPYEEKAKNLCTKLIINSPTFPEVIDREYPVTENEFIFGVSSAIIRVIHGKEEDHLKSKKRFLLDLMKNASHDHLGWSIYGGLLQQYVQSRSKLLTVSVPNNYFDLYPYDYIEHALYYDFGPLQHYFTDGTRVISKTLRYKEDSEYLYKNKIMEKFLKDKDVLGLPTFDDSIVYQIRDRSLRYAPYEYYYPDKFNTVVLPKIWPTYKFRNYYELFGESELLHKTNYGHNLLDDMDYHLVRPSLKKLESHDLDSGSCSVLNVSSLQSDSRITNDAYLTSSFHYHELPVLKNKNSYVPHRRGLYEHKDVNYAPFSKFLDQMPAHYGRLAPFKPSSDNFNALRKIFKLKDYEAYIDPEFYNDPYLIGEALLHSFDYPEDFVASNNDILELITYYSMRAHHLLNVPEKFYHIPGEVPPYSVLLEYLKSGKTVYFEPLIVIPYSRLDKNRSIIKLKQVGHCPYFSFSIEAIYRNTVTGENGLPDVELRHRFRPSACIEGTSKPLNDFPFHLEHDIPLSFYWKKNFSSLRTLNVDHTLDFRFNYMPNHGNLYYNYVALPSNRGNIQIFPNTQYDYSYKDILYPGESQYIHGYTKVLKSNNHFISHMNRFYNLHGESFMKLKTLVLDAGNAGTEKHLMDYTPILSYDSETRYVPTPSLLDFNKFISKVKQNPYLTERLNLISTLHDIRYKSSASLVQRVTENIGKFSPSSAKLNRYKIITDI